VLIREPDIFGGNDGSVTDCSLLVAGWFCPFSVEGVTRGSTSCARQFRKTWPPCWTLLAASVVSANPDGADMTMQWRLFSEHGTLAMLGVLQRMPELTN